MKKLQILECEITDYIRKNKTKDKSCAIISLAWKDGRNNQDALRNRNGQKKLKQDLKQNSEKRK